jgi:hypothetical protein
MRSRAYTAGAETRVPKSAAGGISSRPLWHDACIGMHLCTGDIVAGRTPSKLSRSVHTTRCKIRLRHHAHTRGDLPNGRISGTNGRISGTNGSIFREQHQLADVVGALHELVCTGCLRQWQVLGDCRANSTAPEQLQQPLQLHARARVYPEDTRAAQVGRSAGASCKKETGEGAAPLARLLDGAEA